VYALLVFGPEVDARVWLVRDGEKPSLEIKVED
jgi:hypothetical protein